MASSGLVVAKPLNARAETETPAAQRADDDRQSAAQNRQRQRAALLRLQQSCAEVAEEVERKKQRLVEALREQKQLKNRISYLEAGAASREMAGHGGGADQP